MGFLSTRTKKVVPEFTGLQVQTAVNVLPVPLVYGSPRIAMNIIYANGFKAVKQASGSKGLLSGGKSTTTGFKYFVTFIGALGEGSFGQLHAIFDNASLYSTSAIPKGKSFAFFSGAQGQAPWSVITSSWPADALGYTQTAYVGCNNFPLDSSATIPQLNFVAEGRFAGTCPLHFDTLEGSTWLQDADPAEVIYDFLVNELYGVGFPQALIDTGSLFTSADGYVENVGDAALSTYAQAVGFGYSLVLNNFEPASSILDRWCRNLVVAPVWTGTELRFVPFWDSYADSNPGFHPGGGRQLKYFQADATPLFDLTDDDFIQSSQNEDPLIVSRIDVADVKNVVRVDFRDRLNYYNNNIAEAKDENLYELYGPRVESLGTADEFTRPEYAAMAAQLTLQRNCSVRRTFTFKLPWQFCVLEPMDLVTLTDVTLRLDREAVRIRSVEEDEKGILTMTAEEFRLGAATATAYDRQATSFDAGFRTNVVPASVNDPLIFEPTTQLLQVQGLGVPQIAVAVSAGPSGAYDPTWGGCNVLVSTDDATYTEIGTMSGPSRMGALTAGLAAYSGANPDVGHTLSVDLSESNATLETVTSLDVSLGFSLCVIKDVSGSIEVVGYTTATLTGVGEYDLTGLYRGLYGTVAGAHASGAAFARLDDFVFEKPLPLNLVGVNFYLKFQSFNIWGLEPEDLSDCTAYQYTVGGGGFANPPFAVAGSYTGPTVASSDVERFAFSSSVVFPAGLPSSMAVADVVATGATTYSIKRNGAAIGSLTFAAGTRAGTFSFTQRVIFNVGDYLTITAPATPDATLAGVVWSLLGYQAGATPVAEAHLKQGGLTVANLVVGRWIAANPVVFPAGLAGARTYCGIAPTANATYSVRRNNVEFGTITLTAGSNVASVPTGTETSFAVGDVLTVVAPASPDATLRGIAIAIPAANTLSAPNAFLEGSVTALQSGLTVFRYVFSFGLNVAADASGSVASAGAAGTGATNFDLKKNGAVIGTMNFAAGSAVGTFSLASPTSFAPGDELTIVVQASPDPAISGIAWAIAGTL